MWFAEVERACVVTVVNPLGAGTEAGYSPSSALVRRRNGEDRNTLILRRVQLRLGDRRGVDGVRARGVERRRNDLLRACRLDRRAVGEREPGNPVAGRKCAGDGEHSGTSAEAAAVREVLDG